MSVAVFMNSAINGCFVQYFQKYSTSSLSSQPNLQILKKPVLNPETSTTMLYCCDGELAQNCCTDCPAFEGKTPLPTLYLMFLPAQ